MVNAIKNYGNEALKPFISEETQEYHFGKHHVGYANTLNSLIQGSEFEKCSTIDLIMNRKDIDPKIYNNASQVFNHNFYWSSLTRNKTIPNKKLMEMIDKSFGNPEILQKSYINKACEMFGSGWSWLVFDGERLSLINTQNSDTPMEIGLHPVLVIDLWEHAYYMDYRNDRKTYIETLVKNCLNWNFANSNI